jgi:hypothetical protein
VIREIILQQQEACFFRADRYWGISFYVDMKSRDPDVDGRIILQWIFKKWIGGMDWIEPFFCGGGGVVYIQ